MPTCCVENCTNSSTKRYRLFRYPARDTVRCNLWMKNSKVDKSKLKKSIHICEGHFDIGQFEMAYANGYMQLKKTAVPTIFTANPPKVLNPDIKRPLYQITDSQSIQIKSEPVEENTVTVLEIVPSQIVHCNNYDGLETERLQQKIKELTEKNRRLQDENNQLRKNSIRGTENLKKVFTENQLALLEKNPKNNSKQWNLEDIRKGLVWRFKMSIKTYEFIRTNEQYGLIPLPSNRTLNRRIELLTFEPGICNEVIYWLGAKIAADEDPTAHLCVVSIDEIPLHSKVEFDNYLDRYVGLVSEEVARNKEETFMPADRALVIMARGLTSHWKQTVAYVFSGELFARVKLLEFVTVVIRALHTEKLHVVAVASDMGNTALLDMNALKAQITTHCPHPVMENEVLFWTPDVPHILKNIWSQLLLTDFILPETLVQEHNLPSNVVSIQHVKEMLAIQEQLGAGKIVPQLKPVHIDPSEFEKMRISVATEFFCKELGEGLKFAAENIPEVAKEAETTGWFILQVSRWYEIMMLRDKLNVNENKDLKKNEFLKEYLSWFKEVKFSSGDDWKPIQTGTLLATTTALDLYEKYVVKGKLQYIKTSHLSIACVENLFSHVCGEENIYPGPVRMRQMLRLLSVAQFMTAPASDPDDEEKHYKDFLQEKCKRPIKDDKDVPLLDMPDYELSELQANGLCFMASWAVAAIAGDCLSCATAVKSPKPEPELPLDFAFATNSNFPDYPTLIAYEVIKIIDIVFEDYGNKLMTTKNVKNVLKKTIADLLPMTLTEEFPKCHSVLEDLISKFVSLRLHILGNDISVKSEMVTELDSKSVFVQTVSTGVKREGISILELTLQDNNQTLGVKKSKRLPDVTNTKT